MSSSGSAIYLPFQRKDFILSHDLGLLCRYVFIFCAIRRTKINKKDKLSWYQILKKSVDRLPS
jgi:hypothetical protein